VSETESHSAAKALMKQAQDVKALAKQESQDNTKFGAHVTESLKQAEEAMKNLLQAKSALIKGPSTDHASTLEKMEWQCKTEADTHAMLRSGSHPCAASATFQSDGALGVFNSLGGSFAFSEAQPGLSSGCKMDFRSSSAEKFAEVIMGLSQQVKSCAMLTQDSDKAIEAMTALNEQSKTAANIQKAAEAHAEANDPELKAAATLYRTAKQELQTTRQDLESRKLMAEKISAEQEALVSKDDNPNVQHLSQEARDLVESAESEMQESQAKVVQLTAEVAKLRASYLLQTVSRKVTNKVPTRSLLQRVGRLLLSMFG